MSLPDASPSHRPGQATGRGSGKRRLIVWGCIIVVLALIAVAFIRQHGSTKRWAGRDASAAQPVTVATVKAGDMPVVLTELGTVIPITTVTVQSRLDGYLTQVLFTEGQHVKKGDLLAQVDPRPYEVLVEQYEGQLATAQAQLAQARVDNDRYQRLIKQDSVAAMTAKDQEFLVAQYEGTVKADQGLLDNEKLQLIYCRIIAPVDGRIGIRAVDQGNYITAGQTDGLATLTQMQPISVIFTLPQDQLGQVAERLRAVKTLPVEAWDSSNTTKLADGSVSALDSQIDTSTGTVRLRSIFTNEDEHLFPNQFVNARLLVDTLHNVLIVPTNALQTGPNGQFVYAVQADSTVAVRNVTVGVTHGDQAVITQGIQAGDRIVTDGTNHLRAGAKVTIPAEQPDTESDAPSGQSHRRHAQ